MSEFKKHVVGSSYTNSTENNDHDSRNTQLGPVKSCVYFDISDLIRFLAENRNVSGIQRVIVNISSVLISNTADALKSFEFVYYNYDSNIIYIVPKRALLHLYALTASVSAGEVELAEARKAMLTEVSVTLSSGDVYVIMGAFWIMPDYRPLLRDIKARGGRIGVYIYDLIPITFPHYVHEGTAREFMSRSLSIFSMCDFVMTISEYVATEVRALDERFFDRPIPVYPVTLAQELDSDDGIEGPMPAASPKIAELIKLPFVLCVGTIEVRKNHMLAAKIWEKLIVQEGNQKVPLLVLVGRWGWRVEELQAFLTANDYFGGRVVVMTDIIDSDLSLLYKHCLFTIYPSFSEGWGLPIGESLAYGRPCICSNTTSMPEVGGDLVTYIDPENARTSYQAVHKMIFDQAWRQAQVDRIKSDFVPRTWRNVANDLVKVVTSAAAMELDQLNYRWSLAAGTVIHFGNASASGAASGDISSAIPPLLLIDGWDVVEHWGHWALSRTPKLGVRIRGACENELMRVALRLQLPGDFGKITVVARSHDHTAKFTLLGPMPKWYFIYARCGQDGVMELEFEIIGNILSVDLGRFLTIGMSGIGISKDECIEQRIHVLEHLSMI